MATADTIAVKCPGCQAGFDVPTTLAGKTIRCTSCKTQLPVPAARARGAAEALPTAKSAPSRGSNGPPAKSAAAMLPKGKPSRPRDDDDDDDDDDRPARRSSKKKKAASGGSAMPLILGVVGVLVLAGGGVGAYFVFKKKDEPAAASNSTSGGGTTTPDGGTKGGPPRGMTPPAGDGTTPPTPGATATDGWVTHQGDGFTIDFPAGITPVRKSEPAGGGVTAAALQDTADDTKVAMGAVAIGLPGEAAGVPAQTLLDAALDGLTKQNRRSFGSDKIVVQQKNATKVDGHPAYELTLREPQKDFLIRGRMVAANGKIIIAICGNEDVNSLLKADRFLGSLRITGGSSGEQVAANTPPAGDGGKPTGLPGRRGLDAGLNAGGGTTPMPGNGPPPGMTFPMPGGTTPMPGGTTPMPGPGGPPPGMTFPMPGPGGTTPMPGPGGPPPGMTFPMPGPGGPPPGMTFPMPGPGGPPPGMNFPMPGGPGPGAPPPPAPPPGGFPMVGMPPGAFNPGGGTPGFGGTFGGAGYVTPALSREIDPFFAIAFDLDKSEVFTVSLQAVSATKASYKLNRYTYPDFVHKGDWKLPGLGVRAALDTAGGKLYLATAPFSKTVYDQKGDRIAGTGEVAVFDLAGIRDGKVKERTELKPAATITVTGAVRGLDVSPDGKLLTVLASRAAAGGKGGKASLRQYDTADRKLIKEKELPNAAWDMTRAGDKLYVIEDPRTTAGQSLFRCDAATLEPQPLRLPAGTTDVAFAPDGKLVAAAGATQGNAGDLSVIDGATPPKKLLVTAARKNQNGYARFTPDGKKLLVASHGLEQQNFGPGLDVYDVTDPADPNTYKKVATIRSAGMKYVGGYFHVSPDGERVLIPMTGAVLETAKLTEHVGGPEPPGLNGPGGPGGPGEPGVVGPGAGPMGPGRGGPGFGPPAGPPGAPPPVLGGPGAPMPLQPGPPGAAPPPVLGGPATVPMPGAPGTVPMPGVPADGGAAPPAVGAPGRGRPAPGAPMPGAPGDGPRPPGR